LESNLGIGLRYNTKIISGLLNRNTK